RPTSATHFDLQEYKNGSWSTKADSISGTSTSRPHVGGIYQYRVRAYNAYGTRGYTAVSAEVKVKPPKPTNFTTSTTQAVDSQFTLSWNASPGASNYTIRKRKQTSSGSWGSWSTHATVGGTSRAFGYRELTDGHYQFQVRGNTTGVGG